VGTKQSRIVTHINSQTTIWVADIKAGLDIFERHTQN